MRPAARLLALALCALFLLPAHAQKATGLTGWSLYLDPGHSQTENKGVFGYSEAEKSLRVGLALRRLFMETTDIDTVYMSRTTDTQFVTLSQRSDHANAVGASWFHSLHSDAGPPEVNRTLLLWGRLRGGGEKNPPGGKAMSDIMVERLTRTMRIGTTGSRGDCLDFYLNCSGPGPYLSVNRRTNMPSQLSESGFHTNPTQNQRNMNADWKRLEAMSFYWSILDFHGIPRPSTRIVTGYVTDLESGQPINGATVTVGDTTYTTDTYASLFHRYTTNPDQLANGFYYLDEVPEGLLSVQAEADGFEVFTSSVVAVDSFFTFKDIGMVSTVPPRLVETTPAAFDTDPFKVIDPIVLEFSRPMNRLLTEQALHFAPALTVSYRWANNDTRLVITPDSLLPETTYTLTLEASARGAQPYFLDGNSDGTAGDAFTLTFTTGIADALPPRLVASFPRVNARDMDPYGVVTVVYDEVIDWADGARLFRLEHSGTQQTVPGTFQHGVVNEQSVVTFFPEQPLEPEQVYRLAIDPGIRDQFQNTESGRKQVRFTTTDAQYNITPIDDFENGVSPNWWAPQQSGSTVGIITDSTSARLDTTIFSQLGNGRQAMRLRYGWDTQATSGWLIREYLGSGAPRSVFFDDTYSLQVLVFGDGSGNQFRFALDDRAPGGGAGNHEVSPWYIVDWLGWRPVTWDLSTGQTGTWLGNGILEGQLRIDSFQLTHTSGAPAFGTLYLDDLRLLKSTTGSSVAVEDGNEQPSSYQLLPNYPNPFNPTTTLRFALPVQDAVTLEIFSVTGAKVATLLQDRTYAAGTHEIVWDATGVPSGVYLARFYAGGHIQSSKLTLLK